MSTINATERIRFMEKIFNLLYEPWIKVLDRRLEVAEKSLIDILENAHNIKRIAGETPLQDISIERLLLAVAITVFYRYDENGNEDLLNDSDIDFEDSDEVEELILNRFKGYLEKGRFPDGVVRKYLEKYSERFWLFHPETPFYQVPEMVKDGKIYGTECDLKLLVGNIKDSNNKTAKRLFGESDNDIIENLSYAEISRWLIHLQAFSVNVKKDSNGIGRLGQLGIIKVNGDNIYEEMMLNLCPLDLMLSNSNADIWGIPKPVWEMPAKGLGKVDIFTIDNIPELYTIQSRRIHINKTDDKVESFTVSGGDLYPVEEDTTEQMSLWKWSNDKKNPKIIPRRHRADISAWRELPAILCDRNDAREAGVVSWISKLIRKRIIPEQLISYSFYGMIYDGMSYKYVESIYDSLGMSSKILSDIGKEWIVGINIEIEKCEKVARELYYSFAHDIRDVYGYDKDFPSKLREQLSLKFFSKIDEDFRK